MGDIGSEQTAPCSGKQRVATSCDAKCDAIPLIASICSPARLASFAKPDDALVRKVVCKNERRVLAVYLHVRFGHRGADLARFFKVPRTTAYGWIDWFQGLPEGLQAGILAFMDSQAHSMAALQMPAFTPKPVASPAASAGTTQTAAAQSA